MVALGLWLLKFSCDGCGFEIAAAALGSACNDNTIANMDIAKLHVVVLQLEDGVFRDENLVFLSLTRARATATGITAAWSSTTRIATTGIAAAWISTATSSTATRISAASGRTTSTAGPSRASIG